MGSPLHNMYQVKHTKGHPSRRGSIIPFHPGQVQGSVKCWVDKSNSCLPLCNWPYALVLQQRYGLDFNGLLCSSTYINYRNIKLQEVCTYMPQSHFWDLSRYISFISFLDDFSFPSPAFCQRHVYVLHINWNYSEHWSMHIQACLLLDRIWKHMITLKRLVKSSKRLLSSRL